jgi:hypothetical protein
VLGKIVECFGQFLIVDIDVELALMKVGDTHPFHMTEVYINEKKIYKPAVKSKMIHVDEIESIEFKTVWNYEDEKEQRQEKVYCINCVNFSVSGRMELCKAKKQGLPKHTYKQIEYMPPVPRELNKYNSCYLFEPKEVKQEPYPYDNMR